MKRKMLSIFVITLLMTTVFSITAWAGDEQNPEIEDEEGDVSLDYIDVISAWFFEKPEKPEYLFVALKLVDFQEKWFTIYAVHWNYKGTLWNSGLHVGAESITRLTFPLEKRLIWSYGYSIQLFFSFSYPTYDDTCGSIDQESEIITWKIPKREIGNPQKGDTLTQPSIFTAQRFGSVFIPFGPLFRNLCDTSNPDEAQDYIIKY